MKEEKNQLIALNNAREKSTRYEWLMQSSFYMCKEICTQISNNESEKKKGKNWKMFYVNAFSSLARSPFFLSFFTHWTLRRERKKSAP